MAYIGVERIWRENVYQYEVSDPVLGGAVAVDGNGDIIGTPAGLDNLQAKQLGDRTAFLRWRTASAGPSMRNTILNALMVNNVPAYIDAVADEILADTTNIFNVTVAGGYDKYGPVDYHVVFEANETITPEVGTGAEFIYLQYDNTNNTYSVFSSASAVLWIGPDEPNTGVYTYWYHPFLGKTLEWNGSAWVQIYLVPLGAIHYGTNTPTIVLNNIDYSGGPTPAGVISNHGAITAPWGYLLCHGQAVSREGFARLFAVIGVTWGVGDGSTTFNVPDFRGEFIRGYDAGAGVDSGRVFASSQAALIGGHNHNAAGAGDFITWDPTYTTFDTATGGAGGLRIDTNTGSTGANIGSETRPRNKAVEFIIKY